MASLTIDAVRQRAALAAFVALAGCGGVASGSSSLPPIGSARSQALAVAAAATTTTATIRCITQANSGSAAPATSFTLTLACTPAPGDALIASVYTAGQSAPASATGVTADMPPGFAPLGTQPTYAGSFGQADLSSKIASGAESSLTITDPASNAFVWTVTIYDVETPGAISSLSTATTTLSPSAATITPAAANSLAIGIFGTQDTDTGPPSQPGFWPNSGWTKTTGQTPQYTRLAKATNNVLQGSTYRTLSTTAAFTLSTAFYNGGNLATDAGVAQIVLITPGSNATPTPAPTATPTPTPPTPTPLPQVTSTAAPTIKCITQANSGSGPRASAFTFTLACTPNPGDALIASVYASGTTNPTGAQSLTADVPVGFSQLGAGPTYSGANGQADLSSSIANGTESSITVNDPAGSAFLWAVTIYDVQNPGTITATAATAGTMSPVTPAITPTAANSLAIGIFGIQDSDVGAPSQPGFWPQGGWTKTSGQTPQYTKMAKTTDNVLQGSTYRSLTATTALTVSTAFYNGGNLATNAGVAQLVVIAPASLSAAVRRGFLGAFYRAIGSPPYGVFSATATAAAPQPYPTPGTVLFGSSGYCDAVAANGVSISSGLPVDPTKLSNIVNLGAKWTRMTIASTLIDQSHVFGAGSYSFQTLDAAQCATVRAGIMPVIGLEAGPVNYNANPAAYSPVQVPIYETAADFGQYCGAIANHESHLFTSTGRYSLPDNEVNTDPTMFPGGLAQIATYSKACYQAIKANQPNSFVYGFELNMEYNVDAPGFVQQMVALGCGPGTCYDGLSIHLYPPWPIPAAGTPCFPSANGNYDLQCVTDIRTASGVPGLHILVGETAYMVTATVPDEATKATAVVAMMKLFALDPDIDGVNYANVDECALYPSGEFAGGCLVSTAGVDLPAYGALSALAAEAY